jgi:hypothetical protein
LDRGPNCLLHNFQASGHFSNFRPPPRRFTSQVEIRFGPLGQWKPSGLVRTSTLLMSERCTPAKAPNECAVLRLCFFVFVFVRFQLRQLKLLFFRLPCTLHAVRQFFVLVKEGPARAPGQQNRSAGDQLPRASHLNLSGKQRTLDAIPLVSKILLGLDLTPFLVRKHQRHYALSYHDERILISFVDVHHGPPKPGASVPRLSGAEGPRHS